MSHLLLATKLGTPPPRTRLVKRSRLAQQIQQGLENKLTLVVAPAGYGKTTLVSDCLYRSQAGWLALDENDNDPALFFAYLIAALQQIRPGIGQTALTSLQSESEAAWETGLILLINELATLSDEFVLVLDDYHLITAATIHRALTFLIAHLPVTVHLVVLSRNDPPWPLARYRLRGELVEIRANDLRFTLDEAAAFFSQTMNQPLRVDDLIVLEAQSEGWIAALQAAALSLQGRTSIGSLIKTFSGQHHTILAFLKDEVLLHQPQSLQTFLLQTAILEHLHPDLCDAVTIRSDSRTMLEQMRQANLFLLPMDEVGTWFRYHHLFREALLGLLEQRTDWHIPTLRRRAAAWYKQHALPAEAIRQALLAADHALAGDLISQFAEKTWQQGQAVTLLHWLRQLPETERRTYPYLAWLWAWTLQLVGEWGLVTEAVAAAQAIPLVDSPYLVQSQSIAAAIQAHLALLHNDPGQAIELAQQALTLLPADEWGWRSIFVHYLADAYWRLGDAAAATQAYQQASTIGQRAGNLLTQINAIRNLGELQQEQGQLHTAVASYQRALKLAVETTVVDAMQLPAVGNVLAWLGRVAYERYDVAAATQYLQQGFAICERSHYRLGMAVAQGWLSELLFWQGREQDALAANQRVETFVRQGYIERLSDYAVWQRLTFQVARARDGGDQQTLGAVVQWVDSHQITVPRQIGFLGRTPLILATLAITQGFYDAERARFQAALDWLAPMAEKLYQSGQMGRWLRVATLQAQAYQGLGQTEMAHLLCEQVVRFAYSEGFVAVFVEAGRPMLSLLQAVRPRLTNPDLTHFVDHLLQVLMTYVERMKLNCGGTILVESFTAREWDVLRLLAEGKSNRCMATELMVAESTIKTHLNNIYQKLNVRNRTQAAARLRELHLI